MRRMVIVVAGVVGLFLLWGPVSSSRTGTLGGTGRSTTQWGVLGSLTITTELSEFRAGDVPVSRTTDVWWPGLAASVALTALIIWQGARQWWPKPATPGAAPSGGV